MEYFKSPKFLIYVKKYYNKLSDTDIILYSILFSITGEYNQELTYPIHEIGSLINSTNKRTVHSLIALQKVGLIKFEKINDTFKIYINEPELTDLELEELRKELNGIEVY